MCKYLTEGVDFKTGDGELLHLEEQDSKTRQLWGGHNKEEMYLNVHGFKKLCMKVATEEAERVLLHRDGGGRHGAHAPQNGGDAAI